MDVEIAEDLDPRTVQSIHLTSTLEKRCQSAIACQQQSAAAASAHRSDAQNNAFKILRY